MKKHLHFIALVLFVFLHYNSTGQGLSPDPCWTWQNPKPQGNSLLDLRFLDSLSGWASGLNGTIMHTADGGHSWELRNPDFNGDINDTHFFDNQSGWAVGEYGFLAKTTNGGTSWQQVDIGVDKTLSDIFFLDDMRAWVVGDSGTFLSTTNGGLDWDIQNVGSDKLMTGVHFLDSLKGFVVGSSAQLLKTTDGGQTWTNIIVDPVNLANRKFTMVYFIDSEHGWIGTESNPARILRTIDGGNTWQSIEAFSNGGRIIDIKFINDKIGWITGGFWGFHKTIDGGLTWTSVGVSQVDAASRVLFPFSEQKLIVSFAAGMTFHTEDGGANWTGDLICETLSFSSVDFVDENHGWAGGVGPILVKTTNGGENWVKVPFNGQTISDLDFVDSLKGWVVGAQGMIRRTVNGGSTWTVQNSGTTENIRDVYFINSFRGWGVGFNGTILKTSNSGTQWVSQVSGVTQGLETVFFKDAQHGWCGGLGPNILRTVDGGTTWESISIPYSTVRSIYFLDTLNGWASGMTNAILKTSDGGVTWEAIPIEAEDGINTIKFLDAQVGYAQAIAGPTYKTVDGGLTWSVILGGRNEINDFFINNEHKGWAVGTYIRILKYEECDLNSTAESLNTTLPIRLSPNPVIGEIGLQNQSNYTVERALIYSATGVLVNEIPLTIAPGAQVLIPLPANLCHQSGMFMLGLKTDAPQNPIVWKKMVVAGE